MKVLVRDSKDISADKPDAPFPFIEVPVDRWPEFLAEVGDAAPAGNNGSIFFAEQTNGHVVLTSADSDVALTYDSDEWSAFKAGVLDGDFGPLPATTR